MLTFRAYSNCRDVGLKAGFTFLTIAWQTSELFYHHEHCIISWQKHIVCKFI